MMIDSKRTVAFVPVKLNNERFPGKNLKRFSDGTPLLQVLLDKLVTLKGQFIDEVYVFCSSAEIVSYLPEGVEWLQRPEYLDKNETRGREIYEEFVKHVKAEIYVLAHATSPYVSSEHIRECILKVKEEKFDSAFCAKKIQNFLWQSGKPVNFDITNPLRTQDMDCYYMELSTPYVFTKEVFGKYHSRTGIQPFICECEEIECIDIDYPEDFELANAVYTVAAGRGLI